MIGSDENPAATNARPMTYALLVPQSPYSKAAARFQSRLRGRCTPALASRTISSINCAIAVGCDCRLRGCSLASCFSIRSQMHCDFDLGGLRKHIERCYRIDREFVVQFF